MALSTTLRVGFDATSVQSGFAKMKAGAAGVAGGVAKLGASLAAIGAAGAAGLVALAVKINSIGEAGLASERRLENIVKQMGLFGNEANSVSKRLVELADITERQTGVDGDAIIATQSKLATFKELAKSAGVVGGAFDRATMAAIDMAAAGFGTAEGNAVQLGKALNDPIKGIMSLTKSGITFTAEEKNKIKVLVESNRMLDAQTMVLAAIETQVGGTANATADSSKKIKASLSQIVSAFAEPFSQGFANLPAALEKQFEGLKEMAAKAGDFIGAAIRESIQGNHEKFVLIGEIIGESIKLGLKNALEKTGISAIEGLTNLTAKSAKATGASKLYEAFAGEGSFDRGMVDIGRSAEQARDAIGGGNYNTRGIESRLQRLGDMSERVQAEKNTREINGQVFRPALEGERAENGKFAYDENGQKLILIMEKVEKNTREGAKF